MQIEQNFRDDKNQRWRFGLRYSHSEKFKRLEILLLIAFITTLVLRLIRTAAEAKNLHKAFQENSEKENRILSLPNLARQIIRHCLKEISHHDLDYSVRKIATYQTTYT